MPGNVECRAETHPEKRYYANGKEVVRSCGRGQESDNRPFARGFCQPHSVGVNTFNEKAFLEMNTCKLVVDRAAYQFQVSVKIQ